MNRFFIIPFLFFTSFYVSGQTLQTPDQFLGFELGTKFTPHHKIINYFKYLDKQSKQVKLIPYGESYEQRPLVACAVSSKENIQNLEELRQNSLKNAQMISGDVLGKTLPIVWLSYNIHGDEAVSSEAALKTIYHLLTNPQSQKWLSEVIVILDPCLNPDGRDRYVNWYNATANHLTNIDIQSAEHNPPWPGGRTNHYLFDLNRDWAWQTQQESRQRAKLYHQWMPQVHVDFHEMGIESPYFFAPAAKPFHEEITSWQRDFQVYVGDNNAKYFDQNNWLYYSNEIFDLFYPSYGDTWPIFQGSQGFTYEQGGSRNAGTAVLNSTGDTLTLKDRLEHHFTTGMATIETTYNYRNKLIDEFKKYFEDAISNPPGDYKSYIIKKNGQPANADALIQLLDNQQIKIKIATRRSNHTGFEYLNNKQTNFQIEPGDYVVPSNQPQSRLLKVLMEPRSVLEDSVTYDLTAWSLPYAYEAEVYATGEKIAEIKEINSSVGMIKAKVELPSPIAYVVDWQDFESAQILSKLLISQIKVRKSLKPFEINGKTFNSGSLLISKGNNKSNIQQLEQSIKEITIDFSDKIYPIGPGNKPSISLGSGNFEPIAAPKVALIGGMGVDANAFGELWFYFDRELKYPVSIIHTSRIGDTNLKNYDVLLIGAGSYKNKNFETRVNNFIENGGLVIAMESALKLFVNKKNTVLKSNNSGTASIKQKPLNIRYSDKERKEISGDIAGSIYRVSLDPSHPLAFGNDNDIHFMKRNSSTYQLLSKGWNVGTFGKNSHVSGFVGYKLKPLIDNSLALGTEKIGDGRIVYMTDSPIFRGFWYSGKLLLANAIFLR